MPGMDGGGTADGGMVGTDAGDVDGTVGDDAALPPGRCGDGMLNAGETCDDGNRTPDDGCNAECQLECGDGMLQAGEICDTGIADGETGACPTACDDGDPCTEDAIAGTDCSQECASAAITAPADDDMCCPPGANASNDNDCTAMCGNMALEGTELCDVGSSTECPTSCDDMNSCTTDALMGSAATCDAVCAFTAITRCRRGASDGCCPMGCTAATDRDCSATCGNMVLDAGELCENGSATPCPTSCDDGNACTIDTLVGSAAACTAECSTTPVTMCSMTGDGCCPSGCSSSTDADCTATCGNSVIETGETCDDGNTTAGDGCSATCTAEPIAFRFTDLDLMDPHPFAMAPFLGCTDVTNLSLFGIDGVNPLIQNSIRTDTTPGDTVNRLGLSITHVFEPLTQAAGTSAPSRLTFPDCTGPYASPPGPGMACTLPAGAPSTPATAMNMGAGTTCLDILMGTVRPYSPAITPSIAPAGGTCYVANAGTVTFDLAGISIMLEDASIAGEWFGNPAQQIRDGLIRGFMSEAVANATIIPDMLTGIASIDGQPLSSLLRGGTGNCRDAAPAAGDTDTGPSGARGWYFYLRFTADRVPYTEL
ncbi:MAG: DUF4215 domain-containing protein [Sandaracinaceae bacterium]|nr:DUF4215 domain-containing protein [Sandaracinaceae bacterium]